jgi:hypothetical protein
MIRVARSKQTWPTRPQNSCGAERSFFRSATSKWPTAGPTIRLWAASRGGGEFCTHTLIFIRRAECPKLNQQDGAVRMDACVHINLRGCRLRRGWKTFAHGGGSDSGLRRNGDAVRQPADQAARIVRRRIGVAGPNVKGGTLIPQTAYIDGSPAPCGHTARGQAFSSIQSARCARTGVAPLTGSTVGGKGSVRASAATFLAWNAFAAGVAEAPDCSLETQIQLSEWSITVENAAPAVLAITKCWMDRDQRIGQVIDGDRVVAGIGGVKAAACMIDDGPAGVSA